MALRDLLEADSVLHGYSRVRIPLTPPCRSWDEDGLRASEAQHAVEDIDGAGHLGGQPFVGVGTHGIADDLFVSTDLRLDQSTLIVLSGRLPARTALRGDILDMTVTLGRGGDGGIAEDGGDAGRNYHLGLGMTFKHRVVDLGPVIGIKSCEPGLADQAGGVQRPSR